MPALGPGPWFEADWRVVHSHFTLFAGTTPRDLRPAGSPANLDRVGDPLLRELLGLEDAAMERWRQGDPQGFLELSAPGVTYSDPETNGRLPDREAPRALYATAEGRIRYDISEYLGPRVQRFGDVVLRGGRCLPERRARSVPGLARARAARLGRPSGREQAMKDVVARPVCESIDTRSVPIAGRFAAADGYGSRSRRGHHIGRDVFQVEP